MGAGVGYSYVAVERDWDEQGDWDWGGSSEIDEDSVIGVEYVCWLVWDKVGVWVEVGEVGIVVELNKW